MTEVISLWVIKFLPWSTGENGYIPTYGVLSRAIFAMISLTLCIRSTRNSRKTCRSRLHAPPRGEFYNRQLFKLRNYVITGSVLFGPAGCLEIWVSPGYIYFTRCKRSAALMVMSWRAAFNDTMESKLHENAGGGQIARNDEYEERGHHWRCVLAFADILIIADLTVINTICWGVLWHCNDKIVHYAWKNDCIYILSTTISEAILFAVIFIFRPVLFTNFTFFR